MLFECELPFPPSVNGMFGGGSNQKRFPSKAYKEWLKKCPKLPALGIKQRIHNVYTFAWPDARVRDGQNFLKAPLDFLVNQGVLEDDNWNIVASESWNHIGIDRKNPRIKLSIFPIDNQ